MAGAHSWLANRSWMYRSVRLYIVDKDGYNLVFNVMSVYKHSIVCETANLLLREQHLYGSSRLGMYTQEEAEMIGASAPVATGYFELIRGDKSYELSNHLGNVLSVISDRKIAVDDEGDVAYYISDVRSYSDYYPFGAPMDGRTWSGHYRFGFNGKELDTEGMGGGSSTYDYGFRIYNAALGKFLSVDPLTSRFSFYTPYQFAGNKPVVAIDVDGKEDAWVHSWTTEDGLNRSISKYDCDQGFQEYKSHMMFQLGIASVPETGVFITNQIWNSDGSFTLSTSYTPAVVIDGRGLFEKMFDGIANGVFSATETLNSWGDPTNGYELDGEQGLTKYSEGCARIGVVFEAIPTPITRVSGAILSGISDVIDTGLDYKNLSATDATNNLLIRLGTNCAGHIVDYAIPLGSTGYPALERASKATTNAVLEELENETTTPN